MQTNFHSRFLGAVFATLTLAACGGGSDSTASSNIAKYVGTWQSGCSQDTRFADTSNGNKGAYVKSSFVAKENSSSILGLKLTQSVYAATDTTCSNAVQATITRTGLSDSSSTISPATKTMSTGFGVNTWTYLGALTLGGVVTDKFDLSLAKLFNSNAVTTLGTIQFNTADFPAATGKIALYLSGATLKTGAGSSATADPTALSTDPGAIFTKQ